MRSPSRPKKEADHDHRLDLGDRKSHLCVLDASGEVVEESQLATTPKAVGARFEGLTSARIARMDPKLL